MQTVSRTNFTTVTTEGAILPADLLQRIVEGGSAQDLHELRAGNRLVQLHGGLNEMAEARTEGLLEARRQVRVADQMTGISHSVRSQLPVDVLGLLPI